MHLEATLKKTGATRHWVNVIFSLIGIGIPLLYGLCEGSCSYLSGSIFSVDLKYVGVLYMSLLLIFSLLRRSTILLFFLSLGMGAEIQLAAFQIRNGLYCPLCIVFGVLIVLLFLLNFERSKKILIAVCLIIGLVLFSLFFEGAITPLYAQEMPEASLIPSFGTGQIQVRLYTDYFCGPCSALEPKIEKVLTELVTKGTITITFIDTPIHKYSNLYAAYFLYILNEKKNFNYALHVRAILFEAAKKKVTETENLEDYLKKRNIGFKPFDVRLTFNLFNQYFREDKITATPTCVILDGGKKSVTGVENIMKALGGLSH
jgi:thiol-disulfide isomerase/thioredoxin